MKDLNRRSILQVLGIYLAGSWGALEAVGMIVETAGLPDWLPAEEVLPRSLDVMDGPDQAPRRA